MIWKWGAVGGGENKDDSFKMLPHSKLMPSAPWALH